MLQMLNFDNPNPNQMNASPEMNINYRPPQTANNFYRPTTVNPVNQNHNNAFSSENERHNIGNINLPRVNKSNIKRNNLNMSSENVDHDEMDIHNEDGMKPRV